MYTASYENTGEAFMQMFNHFSIGKDFENTSGEMHNSPLGYVFLYVFSSLLLMLVLSQFFIAILVSAWQDAADLKASIAEDASLPPGYQKRPDERSLGARACEAVVFGLCGYSIHGKAFGQSIKHALAHCEDVTIWNLNTRRAEAEGFWASADDELTREEQNELFLFKHGLVEFL